MAVNTIIHRKNLAANTERGPTGAIWGDCPWLELRENPARGMTFFDDFQMAGNAVMSSAYTASVGRWSAYGYAGATIDDGALEGGVIRLAADGDNEGLAMYSSAGSFRLVTTSTLDLNGKLWFEARIARSTITTDTIEFFAGLMTPSLSSGLPAAAIPITTTDDTLSTTPSLLGFHGNSNTGTRGGPTEVALAFNLASGTVNYPTNMTTLMASSGNSVLTAGGFVKLGFIFDPGALHGTVTSATARQTAGALRRRLLRVFVNGLEVPAFLSADDVVNATAGQAFPTGFMTPVLAVMNTAGSSPGYLAADWVRVAQIGNS